MTRSKPLLVLVTETYPFPGPDTPFLPQEVRILRRSFRLLIAPVAARGVADIPITDVAFDEMTSSLSAAVRSDPRSMASAFQDVLKGRVPSGAGARSVRSRMTLARRWARARGAHTWAREWLRPRVESDEVLVYSWWSLPEAYGIASALEGTGMPMVTRAHGYDLFPEQDSLGFIPFQRELLERVDHVFSVSQAGAEYLRGAHPDLACKVGVAYLGTDEPSGLAPSSSDGRLRIVTCSSVVPVKRLDRMADAVRILRDSGEEVEWTHIGGGPGLDALKGKCASLGPVVRFTGQLPAGLVTDWLARHPVDLFCNVSESEGLPVTLMEAASCGIPLLAADVGGNREIVDASVGMLLGPHPSSHDIADAVRAFAGLDALQRAALREASRRRWEERFRAESNYPAFSRRLLDLAGAR